MSRSTQRPSLDALNAESSNLRSQIASQIDGTDDPLELYDSFVKWIFENYPSEHLASSGLIELLEEATRRFIDDSNYKSDLRYLKLWTHYASLVDKPSVVFKFILTNGIGTTYALLFEQYALALERDNRYSGADEVYRAGIQRKVRPVDRLKKHYDEFRRRTSSKPAVPPPAARVILPKVKGTAEADLLRRQPLKNYDSTKVPAHAHRSASASSSQASSLPSTSTSLSHTRYSHMLAPPVAGKRPEKLRLNLRLLFTEENEEYSMPEARARSMGLLGKKWGPPPASELTRDNASTAQVNFNDDGTKNTRSNLSRRNLAGAEPTVTINTKAALADVFGMYNSPEKSTRFSAIPGGKHAPVRAIEPVTPLSLLPQSRPVSEKPNNSTTTPSFTPFVDENAGRKENAAPPKFKPFVDTDLQARPAPAPVPARRALASKEIGTAASAPAPKGTGTTSNVFSKVFTPVAKEEIKQPPELPSKPEGQVFQSARENVAPKPSSAKFPFLGDAQAPFKVFSRPPEKVSKPGGVTPFVDGVSSTAPALSNRTPLGTFVPQRTRREKVQVHSEIHSEDEEDEDNEDIPSNTAVDYEEDTDEYDNTPFGGRFGQFNVMTPITERTMEYTSTGRFSIPDADVSTLGEKATFGEPDAVVAAERLAAEVRCDNFFVSEHGRNTRSDEATSASSFVPPFRLSDEHTNLGPDKGEKDSRVQAITALVEEKTGTLNLSDEVFGAPAFKPTNPCNPFDPSIISTLLSQLPPNPEHHHSSHSSQLLDDLQKFTRKQKANGSSSASRTLSLELGDKRFCVYEKLGEGGFGAVFAAKVVSPKFGGDDDDDDEDDEDEDDEESNRVAIKVVKPHNIWEFRMLHKAHECLPARLRSSVIHPQALYTFRDESFLVLDLCTQGSLLDIINNAASAGVSQQGACLDELLVMFFTIEFLRLLEGLHGAGLIHGDLKIDNCLIRLDDVPGGATHWAAQYDPAGAHGWQCKGIKLIDFGRAIDTRMYPRDQAFVADWATDARDCVEMREGRPWTFQADYFGLAGIVYCMLYGKYIEASSIVRASPPEAGERAPRYKLATGFKRYWQADLWSRLFDVLLNPCLVHPDGALPLSDTLSQLRVEMEEWLQANCTRSSNTLKGLLKKVELFVIRNS